MFSLGTPGFCGEIILTMSHTQPFSVGCSSSSCSKLAAPPAQCCHQAAKTGANAHLLPWALTAARIHSVALLPANAHRSSVNIFVCSRVILFALPISVPPMNHQAITYNLFYPLKHMPTFCMARPYSGASCYYTEISGYAQTLNDILEYSCLFLGFA